MYIETINNGSVLLNLPDVIKGDQYVLLNQHDTYFQSHNNGRVGIPGLLAIVPQIQQHGHVHVQIIRVLAPTTHKPKTVQLPIVQVNRPRGYKT